MTAPVRDTIRGHEIVLIHRTRNGLFEVILADDTYLCEPWDVLLDMVAADRRDRNEWSDDDRRCGMLGGAATAGAMVLSFICLVGIGIAWMIRNGIV